MGERGSRRELRGPREEPQRPLEARSEHYVARAPGLVTQAASSRGDCPAASDPPDRWVPFTSSWAAWLRWQSRVRDTAAGERAWLAARASEPLHPHRWGLCEHPARWPPSDSPPGRFFRDGFSDSRRRPGRLWLSQGKGKTLVLTTRSGSSRRSGDQLRF